MASEVDLGERFVAPYLYAAACTIALLSASLAPAQQWAAKMFDHTKHDFGTVARNAKAVHTFSLKNIYEEDVHIVGVRSSCGCTIPQITKHDLKTFETGEIVAEFNTRLFLGQKNATLTVVLDKPFPAEVQLHVAGLIRGDVVLQPGAIDLGSVDVGTAVEQKISVTHVGRSSWEIVDAKAVNPHIQVELFETGRGRGKVSYELLFRLTGDAPVGYVRDQLLLVTNDPAAPEIAVDVEGRVASAVTVSPASLFMGVVKPGQQVSKHLVVRSRTPFKIVEIKCDDKSFEIVAPADAKPVHLIPVRFTAGNHPGKVTRHISIATDQGDSTAEFTAYAQVIGTGESATPRTANVTADASDESGSADALSSESGQGPPEDR